MESVFLRISKLELIRDGEKFSVTPCPYSELYLALVCRNFVSLRSDTQLSPASGNNPHSYFLLFLIPNLYFSPHLTVHDITGINQPTLTITAPLSRFLSALNYSFIKTSIPRMPGVGSEGM